MRETPSELRHERLSELLLRQRDLYRQLQDLSGRQRGLIHGDQPEQLLNILSDRQRLIFALAQINEELSPFRKDWDVYYGTLAPEERQRTSALLDEIHSTLQAILASDQEDGALLSVRKQSVARSLGDVSGGRVANAAYARQSRRMTDTGGIDGVTA